MVDYFNSEEYRQARDRSMRFEKLIELFKRLQNRGAAHELATLLATGNATKAEVIACLERNGYSYRRSWLTFRYRLVAEGNIVEVHIGAAGQLQIKGENFLLEVWHNGSLQTTVLPTAKK